MNKTCAISNRTPEPISAMERLNIVYSVVFGNVISGHDLKTGVEERRLCTTCLTLALMLVSRSSFAVASTAGWIALTNDWMCPGAFPLAAIVFLAASTAPQR